MDDEGHGTFTAGEIGEMANNAIGGAGLVWNTQIMPVVFLDSSGSGTDTAAAEAIDYAVNHGAKVINASWGGTGTDPTIAARDRVCRPARRDHRRGRRQQRRRRRHDVLQPRPRTRRSTPTSSRSPPPAATARWHPSPTTASARSSSPPRA